MREHGKKSEIPAKRLFFALWPDKELCQQLYAWGGDILGKHGGRRIPPENLHLTLAFIGSADAARQTCLEQMAAAIQAPRINLVLDQAGFWPHKEILWIGAAPSAELLLLVRKIKEGLPGCGLAPEARTYQAHLTLARHVQSLRMDPSHTFAPLTWAINRFSLVASQTLPEGACYEVVRSWELTT